MAGNFQKKPKLSAVQQFVDLKKAFPQWNIQLLPNGFSAKAVIQPSALSDYYTVRISYRQNTPPKIKVLHGKLKAREDNGKIKHTYRDGSLCLYYPKAMEWTEYDYISCTIVPWISVWLYYYEIWFATGDWLGGGIEHY